MREMVLLNQNHTLYAMKHEGMGLEIALGFRDIGGPMVHSVKQYNRRLAGCGLI
jgi:hypothetical protein